MPSPLFSLRNRYFFAAVMAVCLSIGLFPGSSTAQTATIPTPTPKPAEQTIAQKIAASKDLLDINTATPDQLKALPGIGDAYLQRIIAGRPYTAKNQLATRGVVPQAAYDRIKDQIIAHRPKP